MHTRDVYDAPAVQRGRGGCLGSLWAVPGAGKISEEISDGTRTIKKKRAYIETSSHLEA